MLFVPPFAEEMNKSRRMAALQARALADDGWIVLEMDLYGCGDSEGDFAQASWGQWVADVRDAAAWLRTETGLAPVLWGLRAGCLVARDAAAAMEPAPDLVFWQPSTSGRQTLQQFLRLRVASQLFSDTGSGRIGTEALRGQLVQGDAVEVAGYLLPPEVALGLDASALTPTSVPVRVAWLEIVPEGTAELPPAAQAQSRAWQHAGHQVLTSSVVGPAFWQTQEIAECGDLIAATRGAVAKWRV
jgi:exosortase A-associated hydrolase 2